MRGFVALNMVLEDGGIIEIKIRPEIVTVYCADEDMTLIWFDPEGLARKIMMTIDDFEEMLQRLELNY